MGPDLEDVFRTDGDEPRPEGCSSIFDLPRGERWLIAAIVGPVAIGIQWMTVWMMCESPNWQLHGLLMLLEPLPAFLLLSLGALIAPRSWCSLLLRERRGRTWALMGAWGVGGLIAGIVAAS